MWRLHVLLLVAAIGACSLFSLAQAFSFLPPHASSPTTPSSCHWLARAPRRFTKVGSAPATQETGLEGEKVEERSDDSMDVAAAAAAEQAAAEAAERKRLERVALEESLKAQKSRSVLTAVGSALAAVSVFFYQHLFPVEGITLLRRMQAESPNIAQVATNGRPTVVDFYAEWCENCREMAPILREVESRYSTRVNFVVVNGDSEASADLVTKFRVDGIPHLAFISKEGEIKTALIGNIPKKVIEADLESLIAGKDLPYEGYDAFEEDMEGRFPFRQI